MISRERQNDLAHRIYHDEPLNLEELSEEEREFVELLQADLRKPCGLIYEFKDLEQAKAFATAVKNKWKLDSRVFDDAKAAARSHVFPWKQNPPVVHVDRPWWCLPRERSQKEWDAAWKVELQIAKLATKFGGEFVGT